MISKAIIDDSFLFEYFWIEGCGLPYKSNGDSKGGGMINDETMINKKMEAISKFLDLHSCKFEEVLIL